MKILKSFLILAIILLIHSLIFANWNIDTEETYSNKTFENYSSDFAGVFLVDRNGYLTLSNVILSNNSATSHGGAIDNIGHLYIKENSSLKKNIVSSSKVAKGGAIWNADTGRTTIYSGVKFSSNVVNGNRDNSYSYGSLGGAIYNGYDYLKVTVKLQTTENVWFEYNKATSTSASSLGGAIVNSSNAIMTIGNDNKFFQNNVISMIGESYGGAIFNETGGTLTIYNNVIFSSNTAESNNGNSYGGAIHNNGSLTIGTGSTFNYNKSESNNNLGYGGAILNNGNIIIGDMANFENNVAKNYGGAIHNNGYLTIGTASVFNSNKSNTYGGAILNRVDLKIGSNVKFSSNSSMLGGAIYNEFGVLSISSNAIFNNNEALELGGAIYNLGTLNLIADTGNVEFTSNTANGVSNAIHDNYGTINLWASKTADIVFNDRITSENSNSILNINQSTTTLTANGKVILNEDMSGYTGTTNIYGGEVELQSKTNGNNINTNKFFSGNINFSSGTINIQNNAIDNITVSNWNSTANSNLKFDTDLSNNTSDNFTVTNSASGDLNLTAINILGVDGNTGTITLFNNEKSPELNVLTTGNYGGKQYRFYSNPTSGKLNYENMGNYTFKQIVNMNEPAIRSYSLSNDEIITANLGALGGEQLTIFGNGYEVNGSSHSGITVSNGQTLNIDKGTGDNFVWKKFNNNSGNSGGVIFNYGGTLNIEDNIEFSSNTATGQYGNGGALYNMNNGTIIIGNNVLFKNNIAEKTGGAIHNGGNMNIGSNSKFEYNQTSVYGGGAIFNEGQLRIGSNVVFSSNTTPDGGGAIVNDYGGTTTIGENVLFECNESNREGGAISNTDDGNVSIGDNANFISNTANYGGAVWNQNIMLIGNNVNYISNEANELGGAIVNCKGTLTLKDNNSFILNNADRGGAISNLAIQGYSGDGIINIGKNVNFTSNTATYGGAIYNFGEEKLEAYEQIYYTQKGIINISSNSTFSNNTANKYGGAIYNGGNLTIGDGAKFISNVAQTDCGGAIANKEEIIIGENAEFYNNSSAGCGGAIYNSSTGNITIGKNVNFSNNIEQVNGGAIFNEGILTLLDGGKFLNNSANYNGGAINLYNNGIINLIANTNNVEFTGNTANGISNAIHDNGGAINLWASDSADIIFNDRITSENSNNILNINQSTTTLTANGKVILNEDMSGYTGTVNLYAGTVELGQKGTWFGGDTYVDNATIDMTNTILQEHNFKNITINNNLNLFVDADLANKQMDTISAESYSGSGKINVKAINILTDATENKTEVLFAQSDVLKDKITTIKTASSQLFKYDVDYNNNLGNIEFKLTQNINPIIAESQVASAIGGAITQTAIVNQAFTSIDNQINKIRNINKASRFSNLYASTTNQIFESSNKIESGLWIRPYATQETVKLDSIDVDNNVYGTLAGLDLSVGENSLLSFYLGYAGSNQKYEEIKVNQTGYILGLTGMIVKENYYLGLTANVGFNKAESESSYGTDKFDMNMYSVGAKAGYDIDLGKKWILEPNLTLMYGNIRGQDYTTKQGAKVDGQNTNNVLIEPQVKAKLDLVNGWSPYALVGYMFNSGEKTKLVVNNIAFEDMQISGYMEYGLGINKVFKDSAWSCFIQAIGKGGDRSGFEGNLGVKYSFSN